MTGGTSGLTAVGIHEVQYDESSAILPLFVQQFNHQLSCLPVLLTPLK